MTRRLSTWPIEYRGQLVRVAAFRCLWCGRVDVSNAKRPESAKYCPRPRSCRELAYQARRRAQLAREAAAIEWERIQRGG